MIRLVIPGLLLVLAFANQAYAKNLNGRLGIGLSNQLKNDIDSVDFKVQRSRVYAMGLILNAKMNDDDGGWGAGLKLYRIIFEEPQLTFYAAGLVAAINTKTSNVSTTGFQVDLTVGSEFSFSGLESIGLSFETGLSINKPQDDMTFETVGNHIVLAGIHFYI